MGALRIERHWWLGHSGPDAPLFRELARRWRPLRPSERKVGRFKVALAPIDPPPLSRAWVGRRAAQVAKDAKKARAWNPWMFTGR